MIIQVTSKVIRGDFRTLTYALFFGLEGLEPVFSTGDFFLAIATFLDQP